MQVPHNLSFVSSTGYTFLDPAHQTLPDSLQRTNQENPTAYTTTMSDYLQDAHPFDLGFRTDMIQASLRGRPGNGFDVELRAARRNRSGGKPHSRSWFSFPAVVFRERPARTSNPCGRSTTTESMRSRRLRERLSFCATDTSAGSPWRTVFHPTRNRARLSSRKRSGSRCD
jgi:hypothetical protein